MALTALYLGMVVIGYPIGVYMRKKNISLSWIGKSEIVIIAVLVFMMGARIGANEQVVKSLGTIGVEAFILTLLACAGSVFMVSLLRRIMKFDKNGDKRHD